LIRVGRRRVIYCLEETRSKLRRLPNPRHNPRWTKEAPLKAEVAERLERLERVGNGGVRNAVVYNVVACNVVHSMAVHSTLAHSKEAGDNQPLEALAISRGLAVEAEEQLWRKIETYGFTSFSICEKRIYCRHASSSSRRRGAKRMQTLYLIRTSARLLKRAQFIWL
jgi:hypothetical protein